MTDRSRSATLLTALFLIANMLGLLAAIRLQEAVAVQEAAAQYQGAEAGLMFFGVIGLSTVLLLLLYRFKADIIVKLWFLTALFMTTLIFFDAALPVIPALVLTGTVLLLRWQVPDRLLQNLLDTIPFAGAGAFFGSIIGIVPAAILYALLAVYDVIAVRYSGHMVTLARESAATDTFMGFTYTDGPSDPGQVSLEPADDDGSRVGVLGGGDVIVPMLFATALIGPLGPGAALLSMMGAATALYLFMSRLSGEQFYPAIPVVGAGSLAGLAIWYAVSLVV